MSEEEKHGDGAEEVAVKVTELTRSLTVQM